MQQDKPAVFGPKTVIPTAIHSFPGSQDAGFFTRRKLSSFCGSMLISAAFRKCFKELFAESPRILPQ